MNIQSNSNHIMNIQSNGNHIIGSWIKVRPVSCMHSFCTENFPFPIRLIILDGLLLNGGFGERHKRETPVVLLRLTMRLERSTGRSPLAGSVLAMRLPLGCCLPVDRQPAAARR